MAKFTKRFDVSGISMLTLEELWHLDRLLLNGRGNVKAISEVLLGGLCVCMACGESATSILDPPWRSGR